MSYMRTRHPRVKIDEITQPMTEEKLLTTDQLAEKLGVTSETIRNWRRDGLITPFMAPTRNYVRYLESEAREQLKTQRIPTKK
jgi:hypothetical protein